ncbi:ABC transporter ATP-binding protein [Candidatus Poriferisodalis sp.]|uniref:ABC transporter ATP-binding protein n=1 Tax=Candidatus Poriferisodalis sp. TaxID=3101277 RepID=UPI003C701124
MRVAETSAPAEPAPQLRTAGSGASEGAPFDPASFDAEPSDAIRADRSLGWIRRLGPLLARHRVRFAIAVLAAIPAMITQVVAPRVVGYAVEAAVPSASDGQSGALWPFIVALVALGVARGVFTFIYRNGLYSMGHRVENDLRALLFEHLSRLSFAFYDRVQTGEIISRSNSDIRSVQMFLAFAPIMFVQLLSFVVAIALMAWISLPLTAITMLAMPAVYVLGQRLRKIMFPLSWIIQSRNAEVATVTDESVSGVRVVKAFAAESRQVEAMAQAAQRLRWANMLQHNSRARYTPAIENLPNLALALVLFVGGHQVISGTLTVGDITTFCLYILLLQAPFRFIGMLFIFGQRAKASAERIFEVLDEPLLSADRPGAIDLPRPDTTDGSAAGVEVEFRDVRFAYGTETVGGVAAPDQTAPLVLDGMSLHIGAGERIAVVGRTGCGKTTLARLLLRFYDRQSGVISVDGHDIADVTADSLRRAVGFVPDEPFLFSASIHDNIAYGRPDADRADVVAAAVAAQAHKFICELDEGYDTVVGERGYDLSGGQRQRIAIARAFVADPAVLILDDATSSIDVAHETRIHEALLELLAGRTTIVIAHRLSTISLAERVVLMDGGRIVADGTHAELMATEPRYSEVLAAGASDESADDGRQTQDGTSW